MTVVKLKYVVIVRGPTPSEIAQRVAEAHAVALDSAKRRTKNKTADFAARVSSGDQHTETQLPDLERSEDRQISPGRPICSWENC